MKPALSVVAFTVLSGAGLGALAVLALLDLTASLWNRAPPMSESTLLRSTILALGLVVVGLVSSTLHLGHPRNAWRSLTRLRTSWLSREAAAALALLSCASLWIVSIARDAPTLQATLAIAVIALSWLTLHCTAMIYASLKPIRQWSTRRVPLAYAALGHASGALVVVAMLRAHGEPAGAIAVLAGVLLLIAAVVKLEYYAFIAGDVRRLTIEQAIGVPQGVAPAGAIGSRMRARLFDVGHSRGTFLTREFGYTLTASRRTTLRLATWAAGFAIPALWLALGAAPAWSAVPAVVVCLLGFGAERWLFFAEARHTVRLYHGDPST